MSATISNIVNGVADVSLRMEEDNSGVTGQLPTLEIRRISDGRYFDWDAVSAPYWKTSGGVKETRLIERTWLPGLYTKSWDQSIYDPNSVQTYAMIARNAVQGYELEVVEYHSFKLSYDLIGKSVMEADIYSSVPVGGSLAEFIARTYGLVQGDQFMDETQYAIFDGRPLMTSARIRVYSSTLSVGTDNDVIGTYRINAVWSGDQLNSYKVTSE